MSTVSLKWIHRSCMLDIYNSFKALYSPDPSSFLLNLCLFFLQVNKETSMDGLSLSHHSSVVRPKERRPDVPHQNLFMRGNTIIRSKTFSPGPQSQYICRVTDPPSQSNLSKHQTFSSLVCLLKHLLNLPCCFQINRSDSDSSTLSKKSPFVRNASERRSMRMKKVETNLCTFLITLLFLCPSSDRNAFTDIQGFVRSLLIKWKRKFSWNV